MMVSSQLYHDDHLKKTDMQVICGAAPCGSSLISQFMKKAPESLLFKEGWGMTEVLINHTFLMPSKSFSKVGGGACNVVRSHKAPVLGSVNTVLPNFR